MRFSPSTATFGIAFALVNFGLLAYMGAPLPPQPWLSILIIFVINLLLAIYTPSIISLLNGSHSRRSDVYRPAPEHHASAAEERMINRTRVLIGVETYIAIFLRGSFKDGQYTDQYHNMGFILLMCFFGVWGGMAAIIMWMVDPTPSTPTSAVVSNPDDIEVGVAQGDTDISLNKV